MLPKNMDNARKMRRASHWKTSVKTLNQCCDGKRNKQ